ncbi:MAG: hypothetical protein ACREAY_00085 [Nitrososphaera sp.]|uniref:hypothetical protein n=1 Tax=Nitrososphaera sp. TaxID=1971748 RepID=UPI003D6ECF8D
MRKQGDIFSAGLKPCGIRGIDDKDPVIIITASCLLVSNQLDYCPGFSASAGAKKEDFILPEQALKVLKGDKGKILMCRFGKLDINGGCNFLDRLLPILIGLYLGKGYVIRFDGL